MTKSVDHHDSHALIRFEHLFEENETDDELSQSVIFTLADDFFDTITITKIQEMSLGGNLIKSEMDRLKWDWNGSVSSVFIKLQLHG